MIPSMAIFTRGRSSTWLQKRLIFLLAFTFVIALLLGIALLTSSETGPLKIKSSKESKLQDHRNLHMETNPSQSLKEAVETASERLEDGNNENQDKDQENTEENFPKPDYRVHVFYYPWYGNPDFDEQYLHWNHEYIQHWDKSEAVKWPKGRHEPPEDIGSNFYPALGPYSSSDKDVVTQHILQIRKTGIGVIAVSWYPPGLADNEGRAPDSLMPLLLDLAHQHQLKVCIHVEPYTGRNAATMKEHLDYATKKYGSHPAYYKMSHKGRELPLYYIYDSYTVSMEDWQKLLLPTGTFSIRNTPNDAVMIGLLVEERHRLELPKAGFDGFYTYFASHGFTFGSSTVHWKNLAAFAKANNLLFIPSCGPGYIDTRVRPWNDRNTKQRDHGAYYEASLNDALKVAPPLISITSFNEWHEGTQIEEAIPKIIDGYKYMDYQPYPKDIYLTLTRKWVFKYGRLKRTS